MKPVAHPGLHSAEHQLVEGSSPSAETAHVD